MKTKTYFLLSLAVAVTVMSLRLGAMEGREDKTGSGASDSSTLKQNTETAADQTAKASSSRAAAGAGSGFTDDDDSAQAGASAVDPDNEETTPNGVNLDEDYLIGKRQDALEAINRLQGLQKKITQVQLTSQLEEKIKSAAQHNYKKWRKTRDRYNKFIQEVSEGEISEVTQQQVQNLIVSSGDAFQSAERTLELLSAKKLSRVSIGTPQQQDHVSNNDKASSDSASNVVQNRETSFFTSFYNLVHRSSTRFALTLRASSLHLFPGMPSIGRFIHQLCTAALRIVNPTALANADWEHASSMHTRAQQLKDEADKPALLADIKTAENPKVTALNKLAKERHQLANDYRAKANEVSMYDVRQCFLKAAAAIESSTNNLKQAASAMTLGKPETVAILEKEADQYQLVASYSVQVVKAYQERAEEAATCFEKAATSTEASINSLKQAGDAITLGKLEAAALLKKQADQLQVLVDYYRRGAEAYLKRNEEGGALFDKAAEFAKSSADELGLAVSNLEQEASATRSGQLEMAAIFKKLVDYRQLAADYDNQAAMAYARGDEEEGEKFENAAISMRGDKSSKNYGQKISLGSSGNLGRAVDASEKATAFVSSGKPRLAPLWKEIAKERQRAADYSYEAAIAFARGSKKEGKFFSKAAEHIGGYLTKSGGYTFNRDEGVAFSLCQAANDLEAAATADFAGEREKADSLRNSAENHQMSANNDRWKSQRSAKSGEKERECFDNFAAHKGAFTQAVENFKITPSFSRCQDAQIALADLKTDVTKLLPSNQYETVDPDLKAVCEALVKTIKQANNVINANMYLTSSLANRAKSGAIIGGVAGSISAIGGAVFGGIVGIAGGPLGIVGGAAAGFSMSGSMGAVGGAAIGARIEPDHRPVNLFHGCRHAACEAVTRITNTDLKKELSWVKPVTDEIVQFIEAIKEEISKNGYLAADRQTELAGAVDDHIQKSNEVAVRPPDQLEHIISKIKQHLDSNLPKAREIVALAAIERKRILLLKASREALHNHSVLALSTIESAQQLAEDLLQKINNNASKKEIAENAATFHEFFIAAASQVSLTYDLARNYVRANQLITNKLKEIDDIFKGYLFNSTNNIFNIKNTILYSERRGEVDNGKIISLDQANAIKATIENLKEKIGDHLTKVNDVANTAMSEFKGATSAFIESRTKLLVTTAPAAFAMKIAQRFGDEALVAISTYILNQNEEESFLLEKKSTSSNPTVNNTNSTIPRWHLVHAVSAFQNAFHNAAQQVRLSHEQAQTVFGLSNIKRTLKEANDVMKDADISTLELN